MPLPTALQARLKKRGLINNAVSSNDKDETRNEPVEEPCPNAWNPYHTCVAFCEQRWGKRSTPLSDSNKKRNLKPLPPGWFLVPDPEQRDRSYYWNVNTNLVSWLHPQDPKAEITIPDSVQKNASDAQRRVSQPAVPGEEEPKENMKINKESQKDIKKLPPKIKTGKHPSLLKVQREKERSLPYKKKQKEELDPMDPASYSDIPRGNWSSGLREDTDVKTGVDTTASGPLFQQRPYPSPGDVLRRNNKQK